MDATVLQQDATGFTFKVTSTGTKIEYLVGWDSTVPHARYSIRTSQGPLPEALKSSYTDPLRALKALENYLGNLKPSRTIKKEQANGSADEEVS